MHGVGRDDCEQWPDNGLGLRYHRRSKQMPVWRFGNVFFVGDEDDSSQLDC